MYRDIFLSIADPTVPQIAIVPELTKSVSLIGQLAPGTITIIAPEQQQGLLQHIALTYSAAGISSALSPDRAPDNIYAHGGKLLCPGDSAELDTRIRYVAIALSGWRIGGDNGTLIRNQPDVDRLNDWATPRVQPILRCGATLQQAPAFLPVAELYIVKLIEASPRVGHPTLWLPPGAGSLALMFTDDTDDSYIAGAETGDFSIRWGYELFSTGLLYTRNAADNCDAGGRGSITGAHNAERYDVPPGAIALEVCQPSTTAAFWMRVAVGW
jgi:hypothetical protein